MADIDAAFVQQILDIAKGQRETNVEHHRQADNLSARLEIAEWIRFGHRKMLKIRRARLKAVSSDSAVENVAAMTAGLHPVLHHIGQKVLPIGDIFQKKTIFISMRLGAVTRTVTLRRFVIKVTARGHVMSVVFRQCLEFWVQPNRREPGLRA